MESESEDKLILDMLVNHRSSTCNWLHTHCSTYVLLFNIAIMLHDDSCINNRVLMAAVVILFATAAD